MYQSDKIELISQTYQFDAIGNQSREETSRTVFADIASVGQREFFAGAQQGEKPEIKAVVFSDEYNGETLVRLNKILYLVYRTFQQGEHAELYLTRKAGV